MFTLATAASEFKSDRDELRENMLVDETLVHGGDTLDFIDVITECIIVIIHELNGGIV